MPSFLLNPKSYRLGIPRAPKNRDWYSLNYRVLKVNVVSYFIGVTEDFLSMTFQNQRESRVVSIGFKLCSTGKDVGVFTTLLF